MNNQKQWDEFRRHVLDGVESTAVEVGHVLKKVGRADAGITDHKRVLSPHLMWEIDSARYRELSKRAAGSNAVHHLLHVRSFKGQPIERYFVMGADAQNETVDISTLQGRQRYVPEYIGVHMLHALSLAYGDTLPDKQIVHIAHPPGDYQVVETLLAALRGKWVAETPTHKLNTNVVMAIPSDEIVNGIMNITLNPHGEPMSDTTPILGDGPTYVGDLGGGTYDQAILQKDGSVNFQRIESERIGANQAIERFRRLFAEKFPELVGNEDGTIDTESVYGILLSDNHTFRQFGEDFDCSDIFIEAFNPLIAEVKQRAMRFSRGFERINNVLLTGGVMGLLYLQIVDAVFPRFRDNKRVFLTDKQADLVFGNISGQVRIARSMRNVATGESYKQRRETAKKRK